MGNCCSGKQSGSSSSVKWGGDDWGSVTSKCRRKTFLVEEGGEGNVLTSKSRKAERQKLLGSSSESSSTSSISVNAGMSNDPHHGEIKIKISKKQLEKLLEAADKQQQGLSVNQVLSRLINADMEGYREVHEMRHHQHSWRPVLQSIPEINLTIVQD